MRQMGTFAAALLVLIATESALAQRNYPEKTIRLVTGYLAGGGSDFVTRTTAQKLGELMSTTVIVDNRTGAIRHRSSIAQSRFIAMLPASRRTKSLRWRVDGSLIASEQTLAASEF